MKKKNFCLKIIITRLQIHKTIYDTTDPVHTFTGGALFTVVVVVVREMVSTNFDLFVSCFFGATLFLFTGGLFSWSSFGFSIFIVDESDFTGLGADTTDFRG